ncbi:hypothetical protein MMSR116_29285 [Methylobacterium mesophilicum SR1.6/6]|uniref:Uncharacterized protein n=1 Tax=Methylobacterium mesophilicum SR1.6/6 TaxID=908290 RepID=A0A6B9FSE7_9HYPH|nr:hypothetical protein [Methylobacterium mesophilicum]QGY05531.1 hypothetical protein MMSR116_29285 [Methylobacterium mesophilicum SR1.6/6]
MTPGTTPLAEATADLVAIVAFSAAGISAAILVVGVLIVAILADASHQLRRIGDQLGTLNDHVRAVRVEGIDIHAEAGAIGRPALDAEQLVRGAGFLITLWRKVLRKDGEAIPSAERLTLDLGEAMGVSLPTREGVVAITPRGQTVRSGLLPYGAKPIPAVHDPEAA